MRNAISLMTLSLFADIASQYRKDGDKSSLQKNYCAMMDSVQEAGYQGVDVSHWETALFGTAFVNRVLGDRKLCVSSYIYFDTFGSDECVQQRIERGIQAVDTACALGTRVLMLVPMADESIQKRTAEQIHQNLVSHWNPIVAYAADRDIVCVIEDTPDLSLRLCKAEDVRKILDAVPGLQLVYDSGNMILAGEDPVEYVYHFAGRIGFAHMKDISLQGDDVPGAERMWDGTPVKIVPTGTGVVDIHGVICALRSVGYQGGITVEFAKRDDVLMLDGLMADRILVEEYLYED